MANYLTGWEPSFSAAPDRGALACERSPALRFDRFRVSFAPARRSRDNSARSRRNSFYDQRDWEFSTVVVRSCDSQFDLRLVERTCEKEAQLCVEALAPPPEPGNFSLAGVESCFKPRGVRVHWGSNAFCGVKRGAAVAQVRSTRRNFPSRQGGEIGRRARLRIWWSNP